MGGRKTGGFGEDEPVVFVHGGNPNTRGYPQFGGAPRGPAYGGSPVQGPYPYQGVPGPVMPTEYDPEMVWRNPTYSVPQAIDPELRGYWATGEIPLRFSTDPAILPPGAFALAQLETPLFDLRPDLRGSFGVTPEAQAVFRGAAFGAGARLSIQIKGINGIPANLPMRIVSTERGQILDARDANIRTLQQPQDISEQFFDGGQDVILEWEPPGNPIRYWKVELGVQQLAAAAFPTLTYWANLQ